MLETKLHPDRAVHTFPTLCRMFDVYKILNGNGYAGGIWVFWDSNRVYLSFMAISKQMLTFSVIPSDPQDKPFFMMAIYASPNWRQRRDLWKPLT